MSVEFDRFLGINTIPNGAIFHPEGQKYVYSSGGNVVIGDLMDSTASVFLREHDDFVTALAVSSSGRFMASGQTGSKSGCADVIIWDFAERAVLYRFEEHDDVVMGIAFSEDERVIATIDENKVMFLDMSNGCIIACGKLPPGTVSIAAGGFVKDVKRRNTDRYLFCTAGSDGLMLWDLDPYSGDVFSSKLVGDVRATIARNVQSIVFSEDKETLYGATTSGDYVIAKLKAGRIVQAVQATKQDVKTIIKYNEGVVVGCGDNSVKVFSPDGNLSGTIMLDAAVIGLSPSLDSMEALSLSAAGTLYRINLSNMQHISLSESHVASVDCVVFDEGGHDRFATCAQDCTIKVWDLVELTLISTCRAKPDQERGAGALCLAFADMVYSGWSDGRILAHSAETGAVLWSIDTAHGGGVSAMVLSHNRRFLLTGGVEGEVRLWELRSRELISHLKEHKQKVNNLALSEDDTVALSCSRDRCILRWDLKLEKRVFCHMQRMGGITDITLTKDENYTISVGQDKRIVLWSNTREQAAFSQFVDEERDEGLAVAISHDGKFIATGGSAGVLRLWELVDMNSSEYAPSLSLVSESQGHSKSINSLAFSLDDKQIVTTGMDGAIFVWCFYS